MFYLNLIFKIYAGAGAMVRMEEFTDVAELRALCVILGPSFS